MNSNTEIKKNDKIRVNDPDENDILERGTKKIGLKASKLTLNGKKYVVDKKIERINPFFVSIEGGALLQMQMKDVYVNYKHVNILCVRDGIKIDGMQLMKLYERIILMNDLKDISNITKLVSVPNTILRNYYLRKRANLIPGELMQELYPKPADSNTKYDIDEIVIVMIELSESKVMTYINLYDENIQIKPVNDVLSLVTYYNRFNKNIFDGKIIDMINKIDMVNFWSNKENCNFNMDDLFNMRTLSYNGHRLDTVRYATLKGAKSLAGLLTHVDGKKKLMNKDDNYLADINDEKKLKSEHMNMYQALKMNDNRTFYATVDNGQFGFTKDDIANLFDNITDEKYRFNLLNTMLVSKDLCHFVINNKRVLERNADLFNKYKPLYSYILGYTWVTLYLEESLFSTKSTKKHRFVFDIDTANKLPLFPFSMENIHNNPYVSLLVSDDLIDTKTNCMSVNSLEDYDKYYGICTREEALQRFNIFVSGKHDVNIFKGLDPEVYSMSGSIMPACLQKRCPLIDVCTYKEMNLNDEYGTYYNHYYRESDIDVMCAVRTTSEFLHYASIFLETVIKNINCKREDLVITPNKKAAIVLSKHFFKECIEDLNHELSTNYTVEGLIKMFDTSLEADDEKVNTLPKDILNYFYADYVQDKNIANKKWRKLKNDMNIKFDDELYESFTTILPLENIVIKLVSYDITESHTNKNDNEFYYYINDFRDDNNKVPEDKNFMVFKFSESIKYKITSSKLNRVIEIFKTDNVDPFNTVARFHKPCVRAYLQGETFYMLPSFVTAMMTMINIDYKYFAGSRDPIEIINKYRMRGYSVILNTNEKKSIMLYNKNIESDNGMFKINNNSEVFGPRSLNDNIFMPGFFRYGLPREIYNVSNHKYINTVSDLKQVYDKINSSKKVSNAPINMLEYTAIGKNGCVRPYQKWVSQAYYDYLN